MWPAVAVDAERGRGREVAAAAAAAEAHLAATWRAKVEGLEAALAAVRADLARAAAAHDAALRDTVPRVEGAPRPLCCHFVPTSPRRSHTAGSVQLRA